VRETVSVGERYLEIVENIADAAKQAGRAPQEITLLAVTKFVDAARVREALELGVRDAGESRVQELTGKLPLFEEYGARVHLIGQLQTNKVKYVIGRVSTIQSVDRLNLAQEISREAVKNGVVQDVLAEVNIGCEEQKGGVVPDELFRFLEIISALPNLRIRGLMCIPPDVGEGDARRYFAHMRELFAKAEAFALPNARLDMLSMGMSGDYRAAIAEGSNMVRIGTALFGPRQMFPGGKA
jgi:pyridoxal phosphate enzyme (YggS family)